MSTVPEVGGFAVETLVTDTRTYDVVGVTAETITVRMRGRGDIAYSDGAPYPTIRYFTVPETQAPEYTLRRRKDDTYRIGPGARPLRFTDTPPYERVDYSY